MTDPCAPTNLKFKETDLLSKSWAWRIPRGLFVIGSGALWVASGGCAGKVQGQSQAPTQAQMQADAAMVALRRENDALTRENELLRDKQLMCAAPKQVALAPHSEVKLVPETPVKVKAAGRRGISLQDLPHSAPDAGVMERYAATAAAQDFKSTQDDDPKQYRIVGARGSQDLPSKEEQAKPRGVKALYAAARSHYEQGQRVRARILFKEIEQRYPSSDLADNAIYWQAEDDRESGRLNQAQAGFLRILSDYPAGNKVEDAMFMLGLCFKDRQQFEQAQEMLRKVVSLGRQELAAKARHELALIGKLVPHSDSMNGR